MRIRQVTGPAFPGVWPPPPPEPPPGGVLAGLTLVVGFTVVGLVVVRAGLVLGEVAGVIEVAGVEVTVVVVEVLPPTLIVGEALPPAVPLPGAVMMGAVTVGPG